MRFLNDPGRMAAGLLAIGYPTGDVEATVREQFPDADLEQVMAEARGERVTLPVFVPVKDAASLLGVAPGSAIVGTPTPHDRFRVDYEGGIYAQYEDYLDMLLHAAGRHLANYPTTARRWVPAEDVIQVGAYDPHERCLEIENSDALAAWLGSAEQVERLQRAHAT